MIAANDNSPTGLTFASVCSGIEAASVAFNPIGWRAVCFSEIEKFPSAVLGHHYPDVPNLGDFTKIDTNALPRVDILCGGTPCQAFSVAGLRQSLDDARGNLSLEFVRLAHELTDGNGLRNVIWENVPGVLSTKDNAFGCFLAGLVGADDALPPPTERSGKRRRWPNAGMVAGPKGRAAWRVLDAQFFGLAQRRKRVILVADFGNGADPATVLFEPESVRRDSPPSRETGQGVAPTISARTKGGGGLGTDFDLDGGLITKQWPVQVAPTLNAAFGSKQGLEDQHALGGAGLFVPGSVHAIQAGALRTNPNSGPDGVVVQADIAYTLEARAEVQAVSVALRGREGGATAELGGEVATALRASSGGGDKPHVLAFQSKASASQSMNPSTISPALDVGKSDGVAVLTSAVRRLTPRECERLQGFPDDYTRIPWRGKPADQCPDGPRYKALGNSWAVPLFNWLGKRIATHMPTVAANDNNKQELVSAAA